MTSNSFSISEILDFSWQRFKKKPFFWVIIVCIPAIISNIFSPFEFNPEDMTFSISGTKAFIFFFSTYLSAAIVGMSINYMRGNDEEFLSLLRLSLPVLIQYILGNLFVAILICLGCVFFILPGIYIAMRLFFVQYLIIDKKQSFVDAIQTSWFMTEGSVVPLFLYLLTTLGVVIVSVLCLVIGLLIALPIVSLATAYLYIYFDKLYNVNE